MRPVWIIQKNLTSELHRWEGALWENKSSFRHIEIVPFSDDLPDVEVPDNAPVICHGTTTLIKNAHKKNWKPGIFFTPEHFEPLTWCDVYGRHFINWSSDGFMMLKDVEIPDGELRFMRPNGDFKDFSGCVVNKESLDRLKTSMKEGGFPFTDELIVCVADVQDIAEEYRLFIVNDKIVSASKYRLRTIMDKKPGAPSDVMYFGRKMASIWSPEKAYVMDVCRNAKTGNIQLLELNCFNASGAYAAPLLPVVRAVEDLFRDIE